MNAPAKLEKQAPDNLALWSVLSKTDPKHTKGFSRAGGFKGTAVKPIWTVKRLTEQFGPCGEGWGINEPRFEMVHSPSGEVLVYCTVSVWHGSPENVLWGVGGDKAISQNKHGMFHDDEAFKKAFTDAVGNAFKFIGVAADIHMGLFEDSKYLAELEAEFSDKITEDQIVLLEGYATGGVINAQRFLRFFQIEKFEDLPADRWGEAEEMVSAKIDKMKADEAKEKEAA